ncbi:acyl-CoA/acyl-ACP dehydrogenase [Stappia taiwanensis]|uniref:Acyl-CoA/acyl-ACP dehydrogenase n=1 Tax=Stappia taiwanensis TaxID=992267 RepID=A0A838Y1Q1_9HYPH|nr:acyl-CoA dehydrogenase family protein [Stappia taiwanensis]MBA4612870.1 acyl-CoA/acyl-ACP dehydrogenase [Stappia taiwanensis]GGF07172.1 BEC protein [Stappia taiwanensis]
MNAADPDTFDLDAPIFDPDAFRLTDQERELTALARRTGKARFAPRAAEFDRDARFPTENYRDMHEAGLLGACVPKENGGHGAPFRTYMMTAAEIGRYCGSTALTWNMHVCSCLWTGALTDDLDMTAEQRAKHMERRAVHYARILDEGAIYSQPFSEGGAAAAGAVPFSTSVRKVDGGWLINGKKIFASLSGHADYYGVLCGEMKEGARPSRRDTMYIAVPARAEGVEVVGDWDPLGMRGTVSRTLLFKDVFVSEDEQLMPRGVYYQAASRWPHMFMTLSPTYMGIAQAAFDFTVKYLRGEWPGLPPVKRRMFPTKQMGVAQMHLMLEQTKALWFQAITEAGPDPSREQMLRAWAAHYTVMENANEICQLAIRTCGGQSMLKTLPLERLYRDSRCGALMLPWTAEICLDRIGRESLYLPGEDDT